MAAKKETETVHISQLQFSPRNARKRTERSSHMIRSSLEEFGGMRSLVVDEHNQVRAGNGTLEEAGQIGIEKVRIIDATGDELIAVRRHGLTEEQWKRYEVKDNRSSDLSSWDAEVLEELNEEIDLREFFFEPELDEILSKADEAPEIDDEAGLDLGGKKEIECECPNCGHQFTKLGK